MVRPGQGQGAASSLILGAGAGSCPDGRGRRFSKSFVSTGVPTVTIPRSNVTTCLGDKAGLQGTYVPRGHH